jgi:hypothetical protein
MVRTFSDETVDYIYSEDFLKKEEFPNKVAAANYLNILIRTLDRRCKDKKPLLKNNEKVIVSFY